MINRSCGVLNYQLLGSSCIEWHGNTLAVNSTKSNWIWAAKDGPAVSSSSQGANLQMHDDNGQFTFDLTQSRSGNSLNPFADQATTTAAAGSSTSSAAASSGERDSGDGDSLSASSSSSGEESGSSEGGDGGGDQILIAHGVIMSLAWVIFFPLGAIIIRALPSRHVVRLHYMTQVFAYILALTGMALGIYVAVKPEYLINIYHPIIGLVVMGLATIQPILGTIHHRIYKAKQQRTGWAVAHVWLGRIVITLAIINGGLGLRMAANTKDGEIAYGVVAGVVWLVWMAVAIRHEVKNARATGASESQKHTEEKVSSS